MEARYRIEEETTTGWNLVEQSYVNLKKEQAQSILVKLMQQGYNPQRMRVVREK